MINFITSFFIFIASLFTPFSHTDEELIPYYNNFINIIKEECPTIKYFNPTTKIIQFANLNVPTIGQCALHPMYYIIKIDRSSWKSYDENERKTLVFHEFTHCLLKEDHSDNSRNYMYPTNVNYIEEEILIKQIKEYARRNCEI